MRHLNMANPVVEIAEILPHLLHLNEKSKPQIELCSYQLS